MSRAQYTIHVPNTSRQIAIAAHHYLTSGPIRGINAATVQYGHPHDSLNVVGEETPELDSHMKQTGAFIGELANAPFIDVMKQGKQLAHWPIRNPHYQAQPAMPPQPFAGPQGAPLPSSGPFGAPGLPMAGAAA